MRNNHLSPVSTADNRRNTSRNRLRPLHKAQSDLPLCQQACGELSASLVSLPFDTADPRLLTAEGVPAYNVEIVSEELWNGAQA